MRFGQVAAVIGGGSSLTTDTFEVLDPSSGQAIAKVMRCGGREVDAAVAAARTTFEMQWRFTTAHERSSALRRFATVLRQAADELALTESYDTGKPLRQGKADVEVAASYFDYYADIVRAMQGEVVPTSQRDTLAFSTHEPYGVTGHIVPWNYPLQICARTLAPALAAGNCCVLKPAEEAPLTCIRLGELALAAGLPSGALSVVPGLGSEAGLALASHSDVNFLAFTGSPEVGTIVTQAGAANHVPVALELGGKSPQILFADADLEKAIKTIANSVLQNAGQTCSAGTRLLVEESIHRDAVEDLRARFEGARMGRGPDDADIGPLISLRQRDRVEAYVELGRSAGTLITGGAKPAHGNLGAGFYYLPTILDNVEEQSRVAQEEIFGPVLTVFPFRQESEAQRLANATRYGLVAGIWTKDIDRALWLSRELRAGQVFVNNFGTGGGVEIPFGGYKRSGHGRDKGIEGWRSYTQVKTVSIAIDSSRPIDNPVPAAGGTEASAQDRAPSRGSLP